MKKSYLPNGMYHPLRPSTPRLLAFLDDYGWLANTV